MRNSSSESALYKLKLIHTIIWAFFAICIVAIPLAAFYSRFSIAAVLSGLVWIECAVLATNNWRCPLTDVAGGYTTERSDNFDIFLPPWLARYNKTIFGSLFVAAEIFALARWVNP